MTESVQTLESPLIRLTSPRGDLPLRASSATTRIDALLATTTITQRFTNHTDSHLELTYTFPLPTRASVTDLTARLGDSLITGLLKERTAARADYATALANSQSAALLEQDRSDAFTISIGNLAPKSDAVITLTIVGPLATEDNEATFRFPLVLAPRYVTGSPTDSDPSGAGLSSDTDLVPDAARLNPPRLLATDPRPDLDFAVVINEPRLTPDMVSFSRPMTITRTRPGQLTLTLDPHQRLDSDLIVRFTLPARRAFSGLYLLDAPAKTKTTKSSKSVKPAKSAKAPAPTAPVTSGTFALTMTAPASVHQTPRDLVFVLDRSGSMSGWKITAARRAIARLIDSLSTNDRFALIGFDDRMDLFSPDTLAINHPSTSGPSFQMGSNAMRDLASSTSSKLDFFPATDYNRFRAVTWLSALSARGGTEMAAPLALATRALSTTPATKDPVLVLVTDGQIAGEAHLLETLSPLRARTSFCIVGIDQSPNNSLLNRLAGSGAGLLSLVESEDRLDHALVSLRRRLTAPDLLDVTVSSNDFELELDSVTPSGACDLYSGVPVTLSGRFSSLTTPTPRITLTALTPDGETFSTTVDLEPTENHAVSTLWARARISDLEDAYDTRSDDLETLRAKILNLSLGYKVLSRFSAFVAVDESTQLISSTTELTQPVEPPAGWATASVSLNLAHGADHSAMASMSAMSIGVAPSNLGYATSRATATSTSLGSLSGFSHQVGSAKTSESPAHSRPFASTGQAPLDSYHSKTSDPPVGSTWTSTPAPPTTDPGYSTAPDSDLYLTNQAGSTFTDVGSILTEALTRLHRTKGPTARVIDLMRALVLLSPTDPVATSVLLCLTDYLSGAVSCEDACVTLEAIRATLAAQRPHHLYEGTNQSSRNLG